MDDPKGRLPWKRFLAEGVAIVASILVALGVDAAWESRADRRAEAEELSRLAEEFQTNIDDFRRRIAGQTSLLAHQDSLRMMLESGARDRPISVSNGFLVTLLFATVPEPETAVMDALISSGRLSLITDPDVREGLASVSSRFSELELMQEMRARDHYMDHVLPYLTRVSDLQSLIDSRSGDPRRLNDWSGYPWLGSEGRTTVPNSIEFRNLVYQQRLWSGEALRSLEESVELLEAVHRLLVE